MVVKRSFGQLFKRYFFVVTVPAMFGYFIYADYSHTQKWKAGKIDTFSSMSDIHKEQQKKLNEANAL